MPSMTSTIYHAVSFILLNQNLVVHKILKIRRKITTDDYDGVLKMLSTTPQTIPARKTVVLDTCNLSISARWERSAHPTSNLQPLSLYPLVWWWKLHNDSDTIFTQTHLQSYMYSHFKFFGVSFPCDRTQDFLLKRISQKYALFTHPCTV